MCFDDLARVSRAAAQLAFFVADVFDVYEGAVWSVFTYSLFLNALPVLMLATGFFPEQGNSLLRAFLTTRLARKVLVATLQGDSLLRIPKALRMNSNSHAGLYFKQAQGCAQLFQMGRPQCVQ